MVFGEVVVDIRVEPGRAVPAIVAAAGPGLGGQEPKQVQALVAVVGLAIGGYDTWGR